MTVERPRNSIMDLGGAPLIAFDPSPVASPSTHLDIRSAPIV
jgi:hypothetical protein